MVYAYERAKESSSDNKANLSDKSKGKKKKHTEIHEDLNAGTRVTKIDEEVDIEKNINKSSENKTQESARESEKISIQVPVSQLDNRIVAGVEVPNSMDRLKQPNYKLEYGRRLGEILGGEIWLSPRVEYNNQTGKPKVGGWLTWEKRFGDPDDK